MKPGEHPEFFRLAPPEGRSRESTIRLDAEGRFFHDGELVEHPGLAAGMNSWISRHPDDGRFILTNGYDWTYFTVEDAPFFVRSLRVEGDRVLFTLSDATEEAWDPSKTRIGADGALYVTVKASAERGPFEAKLTRHAQASLAPLLVYEGGVEGGAPALSIGGKTTRLGGPAR